MTGDPEDSGGGSERRSEDVNVDAEGTGHEAEASANEAEASPGEDAASAVPARQVVAAEFAPMRDLLSRASAFVSLPEPAMLAADVRSMPPHERFESAAERHVERLGVDSLDAMGVNDLAAGMPVEDPVERASTFLARRSGRLQGRLLGELGSEPERPRDYLVLAVGAAHLQRAAVDCQVAAETGDGDLAHLASVAVALTASYFGLVEDALASPTERDPEAAASDDPVPDDVVRDVALAEYHRSLATGDDPGTDPLSRDVDDLRHLLVVQGATLAVTELDADPVAVAELADVPLEHLVGILASE